MVIDVIKRHAEFAQLLQHYGYQVRSFTFFPEDYEPGDLVLCGHLIGNGYCSSFDIHKLHERYPDLSIIIVTVLVADARKDYYLNQFPILDQNEARWSIKNIIDTMMLDTSV